MTAALSMAGLALSAYLTVVHYTEPRALSCPDTGIVNCTKVTTSPQSLLLGFLPVALAGLLYFAAMSVLCTPVAWRAGEVWLRGLRVAGAVAGIAMVCYLVYVEAVVVHALCLWCTGVHVVTFLLFVSVLAATVLPPRE